MVNAIGAGSGPAGGGAGRDLVSGLAITGLRAIAWPLSGLISDRPAMSIVATVLAVALVVVAVRGAGRSRSTTAWLIATLGWAVAALAVFVPSLAVITPGLPNDHYHAFLDPLVMVLVATGIARLASTAETAPGAGRDGDGPGAPRRPPRAAAAAAGIALVAVGVVSWPPAVAEDGGWRLVNAAATRVVEATRAAPGVALVGIPPFKSADALRFPLERLGLAPVQAVVGGGGRSGTAVVVCDPLFDGVVGAACGGPAEDRWRDAVDPAGRLVERFTAGPRRVISIYEGAFIP
jgi:hypothetical protein